MSVAFKVLERLDSRHAALCAMDAVTYTMLVGVL